MRCRTCHYRLNDLAQPRCPECGTHFDPADPDTFVKHTRIPFGGQVVFILIQTATLLPILLFILAVKIQWALIGIAANILTLIICFRFINRRWDD